MATYTPAGETALEFHLLIDPPTRETRQTMSERVIPGTNSSRIDIIGKTVTKIRGQARFDSYGGLTTFEGAVGSTGVLVYSEEPTGIDVIFVSLQRTRVTQDDLHLAGVEFWIIPSVGGTLVAPRHVSVSASASSPSGPVAIDNVLSARVSYGFDMRTGECRLVVPVKPECTYDAELTVAMGAGGTSGTDPPTVRFVGLIRDFLYQDGAASVTIVARGYLTRAIEYENPEQTVFDPWGGAGGILIPDLVGTLAASSADIVMAVLDKAQVPYDAAHIGGSAVLYGAGLLPMPFLWRSGGTGPNTVPVARGQGESAMGYIERYDTIDAEIDAPNTGGRYRTFETLAGDVYRVRVGGRPQVDPDFTLTEGMDVLAGNFTRSISSTRNYFVVTGQDRGQGFGALNFGLQSSNDFQSAAEKHTYSLSSDMIERQTIADDPGISQAATGMSCETLANALALEFNRETVTGWVETFRDDVFGLAQTHLVQGGPGGTIGALGLGENVWVQSLEISVDERGFTQRVSYLGGGLAEETMDPLLAQATGRAAIASVA